MPEQNPYRNLMSELAQPRGKPLSESEQAEQFKKMQRISLLGQALKTLGDVVYSGQGADVVPYQNQNVPYAFDQLQRLRVEDQARQDQLRDMMMRLQADAIQYDTQKKWREEDKAIEERRYQNSLKYKATPEQEMDLWIQKEKTRQALGEQEAQKDYQRDIEKTKEQEKIKNQYRDDKQDTPEHEIILEGGRKEQLTERQLSSYYDYLVRTYPEEVEKINLGAVINSGIDAEAETSDEVKAKIIGSLWNKIEGYHNSSKQNKQPEQKQSGQGQSTWAKGDYTENDINNSISKVLQSDRKDEQKIVTIRNILLSKTTLDKETVEETINSIREQLRNK